MNNNKVPAKKILDHLAKRTSRSDFNNYTQFTCSICHSKHYDIDNLEEHNILFHSRIRVNDGERGYKTYG